MTTTTPLELDTADPRRYEHLTRVRLEDPRAGLDAIMNALR